MDLAFQLAQLFASRHAMARHGLAGRQQVVEEHAGADQPGAARGIAVDRNEEAERPHQVGQTPQQDFPLAQRFQHQGQLAVFQIADPAVNEAGGAAGGAGAVVLLLH